MPVLTNCLSIFLGKRSITVSEPSQSSDKNSCTHARFTYRCGYASHFQFYWLLLKETKVSWLLGVWGRHLGAGVCPSGCLIICAAWNGHDRKGTAWVWFVPTVTVGRWIGSILHDNIWPMLQSPIFFLVAGLQYSCDLPEIKYFGCFFPWNDLKASYSTLNGSVSVFLCRQALKWHQFSNRLKRSCGTMTDLEY